MSKPFIFIDLFAGAGGTSTGAEQSGVAHVAAAVNHDPVAISSHTANHPNTIHFVEDITTLNLNILKQIVETQKQENTKSLVILWGSPDCTHFSRAKSGPKNRDTRSLADSLPRYAEGLDVDLLLVENVEEFTSWGPLCENNRPISRQEGRDYMLWVESICKLGYKYEYRILNAADYGAHTSRRRYFGMFYRPGVIPAWPTPTHTKKIVSNGLFHDDRKPWRPVREVLDMNDWGRSIFERPKPLVDRTLRRIINGILKFAAEPQVMTCNTPGYCQPVNRPVGAITKAGHKALVTPMLLKYYRTGQAVSTEHSAPTVTTKDRMALCTSVHWMDYNYGSQTSVTSIDAPVGTVTASPKIAAISAARLVSAFLVNPQFGNKGNSIHSPAPTVVASQKSWPLSIAVASKGKSENWEHKATDTDTMRELKNLMRRFEISDVYMRMLHEKELARIQGFPKDYILHGTAEHRKKQIGNAVVSHIPKAWLQALAEANNMIENNFSPSPLQMS